MNTIPTQEEYVARELASGKSVKEALQSWKDSGFAIRRKKGGRQAFYDYLRDGGRVRNVEELKEYIASPDCEFSDHERKTSVYGHWLAIAELVESVRG